METSSPGRAPAPARRRRFETTQWTLVVEAGEGDDRLAREALASLCQSYWHPVYAYLRARGLDRQRAEDVTQGFFTRLIETGSVRHARRERGRFRSFLLASLENYLSNERQRERALKRGGGRPMLRLETDLVEDRLAAEPTAGKTPEDLFVEQWAFAVLDRVTGALAAEMRGRGQGEQFEALRGHLTGGGVGERYQDVAARLGMTEGSVKVRVHRMRKRFGELLRDEVAQVVASPGDVDDELAALLGAVAS